MIRRLTHVKDFRCFQGWRSESGAIDFQRLNLIYAPNGTGKSTLAALLTGVPQDPQWRHGMKITVERSDGTHATIGSAGDPFWDDVRVFSAEYVRANIRFDVEDGDGAPALMYLGERSIERQERHEAAEKRIRELTSELDDVRGQHTREIRLRDRLGTDKARDVGTALAGAAPGFNRGFDRRKVWAALKGGLIPLDELAATETEDRHLIDGAPREKLTPLGIGPISAATLRTGVVEVLARTATSNMIAELRDNRAWADWVQHGVELHRDRAECLLCGSEMTPERLVRLDEHFDEGYTRLQQAISTLQEEVSVLQAQAQAMSQRIPAAQLLHTDLRQRYERETKHFEKNREDFLLCLESQVQALESKKAAPFSAQRPPEAVGTPTLEPVGLDEVIAEHNRRTDTFLADRAAAAAREFHRMLHPIAAQKREHDSTIEELDERVRGMEAELERCRAVLRETHQEELDPYHFLQRLNDDISSLLGHRELVFDYRDQRYQVLRAGEPARNLSEGEKTAIALLYFLQSLEEQGRALKNTVVVVDDPVSSLDERLMFGVYSELQTRLDPGVHCRQLIVLTHSYEFLRHWAKDLKRGKTPEKRRENATLHWMKSVEQDRVGATAARRPVLVSDDLEGPQAKILESEYFHLFRRAALGLLEARTGKSIDADIRIATSVPNDARKLLEQFLGFKFPMQAPNFTNLAEKLSADSQRRTRLVRFLHGKSHNRPGGGFRPVANAEATTVITDVFALMHEADPEHYVQMCRALGLADECDRLRGL
ncbi:wobble nucleotide-excising tRNase [Spinactinospora alkalitolerans]|uniref:Wobble nucleotide-excising tRNase n=1 Tax=Spinactinospora alkalitolerans TaxID=687207 RepID=A0A852TS25_9ACTN|nr:AAA family ATPase [Spinactinospora alkalitolerans]NYE47186.1 wobble nucleotide-excising tRNase [Spinactinospora alkalitolerans]